MPALATVLFSVFGKQVTLKHLLYALGGIILAVALFFAFRFIDGYFKHIKEIETQNAQLQQQVGQLQQQKSTVIQTNHENVQTDQVKTDILTTNQNTATEERHASQQRTSHYKEISHAIQSTPSQPAPVPPVISNTLDGLWGPAPESHK